MRTKMLLMLAAISMSALQCLADWGQAESPDFALDTTIPEPALLTAVIAACLVWQVRRKA